METSAAKQSAIKAPVEEPKSEAAPAQPPSDATPTDSAQVDSPPHDDVWRDLLSATQGWLQYGTLGFAILCIIVGAVEALFGR